uniref:SCAN box domain-containing protein n=1 Tax=Pygocentrus nattereri TaxID=42514 RepID=A0AAR2IM63_PYGNA
SELNTCKRGFLGSYWSRIGQTPEQQFCSLTLQVFDQPFVLAQQINSCRRWLLSEEHISEKVFNLLVLEQFIACLHEETAACVQCHQPETLDEARKKGVLRVHVKPWWTLAVFEP